jgi:hypothetical protein
MAALRRYAYSDTHSHSNRNGNTFCHRDSYCFGNGNTDGFA